MPLDNEGRHTLGTPHTHSDTTTLRQHARRRHCHAAPAAAGHYEHEAALRRHAAAIYQTDVYRRHRHYHVTATSASHAYGIAARRHRSQNIYA